MRVQAGVLAILGAAALVTACGQKQEAAAPASDAAAPAAPTPAAAPAGDDDDAGEKAERLAALPAPYNTADLANGQRKFALCRSCHTITEGGANMTGPNLYGVFGRTAGTAAKFNYSDAVKAAGFTWDEAHLDQWVTDPRAMLPGNRMSFVGVKDAKDRVDLIAWLRIETGAKSED